MSRPENRLMQASATTDGIKSIHLDAARCPESLGDNKQYVVATILAAAEWACGIPFNVICFLVFQHAHPFLIAKSVFGVLICLFPRFVYPSEARRGFGSWRSFGDAARSVLSLSAHSLHCTRRAIKGGNSGSWRVTAYPAVTGSLISQTDLRG